MSPDLYNILEKQFYKDFNTESAEDKNEALRSLRWHAYNLWESYRQNGVIDAQYFSKRKQWAYIYRYFPSYTIPLYESLRIIPTEYLDITKIQFLLAGGGPCPESVGIIRYLSEKNIQSKILIHTVDKNSDDWKDFFHITHKTILPQLFPEISKRIIPFSHKFDFSADIITDIAVHPEINQFSNSDIIIFQNSLNEMTASEKFYENFRYLLTKCKNKSHIILLCHNNYESTDKFLNLLRTHMDKNKEKYHIICDDIYNCHTQTITRDIPERLYDWLFDHPGAEQGIFKENFTVIPAKTYKYNRMIFRISQPLATPD